jgi:serpin B
MNTRPIFKYSLPVLTALTMASTACGGTGNGDTPPTDNAPGELLMSSLSRDLSPTVAESIRTELSADNRDFAFDLLGQIRAQANGNIFFSPHSISIALAMTYAGASGGTLDEMGEVMRFTLPEAQLHPAFNALDLELARRSEVDVESGDAPRLNIVNAIWGQNDYPFSTTFLDTLAVNYGAGLRAVDFMNEPEAVRQRINGWVEDQTNERIQDLLPDGSITPNTVLVLTNAIYFLAGWQDEFPKSATSDQPFTRPNGSTVTAPLMRNDGDFAHYIGDDTHAIALPYVGGELTFIAMMPADGEDFAAWESGLDRERFDAIVAAMSPGQGRVSLPRFGFKGDYDLKALFEKMGWTNFGELNRMLEGGQGGLEISDILHKSFIKLDEEGTEAAAATAVVVRETSAPIDVFDLRFDRPFYYVIYDEPTDTILFVGRLADPTDAG